MPEPTLAGDSLAVDFPGQRALDGVSLEFHPTSTTAVVGPNGCGKSTLLRALARLLRPAAGTVYLDGKAIAGIPTTEVARRLAILPQNPSAPEGITVAELVEQGRYAHVGPLRMLRRQDHLAIGRALALTDMTAFADRYVSRLSGGERQRVWIAMTLAQDAKVMLLDEPTTFLDIRHQLEVLELVSRLNREEGMTIVMALHDINHAARYSDRLVGLKRGAVVADGPTTELVTPELMRDLFEVDATVTTDSATGRPVCIPRLVATGNARADHGSRP